MAELAAPRRIGALFLASTVAAALLSLVVTVLMRQEMMSPALLCTGPCEPSALVTAHGLLMVFFTLMPALCGGLGLWLLPAQIGAARLALPRAALAAWGLHTASLGLALAALLTSGTVAALLALVLTGASSILVAIVTITTFLNHRAPGLTLARAPLFAWSLAITAGMTLLAVPAVAGAALLMILRGTPAQPETLWFFAHPLIYVIALPAFGIVSEIVAASARRPLAGRPLVLAAMALLAGSGITLWLEELYSATPLGLASTALILPALAMVGAWIVTLSGGIRVWNAALFWAFGFMALMLCSLLTLGAEDATARFHYAMGLGGVFGAFGGLYFWLPAMTRRRVPDWSGKLHAALMFVGVNLSFLPPLLGLPDVLEGAGMAVSLLSFGLFLGVTGWALRHGRIEPLAQPWDAGHDAGAVPARI